MPSRVRREGDKERIKHYQEIVNTAYADYISSTLRGYLLQWLSHAAVVYPTILGCMTA
jgi:hypothetical protein